MLDASDICDHGYGKIVLAWCLGVGRQDKMQCDALTSMMWLCFICIFLQKQHRHNVLEQIEIVIMLDWSLDALGSCSTL